MATIVLKRQLEMHIEKMKKYKGKIQESHMELLLPSLVNETVFFVPVFECILCIICSFGTVLPEKITFTMTVKV